MLQLVVAGALALKDDDSDLEIHSHQLRATVQSTVVKMRNREKYQVVFTRVQSNAVAAAERPTALVDDDEDYAAAEQSNQQQDEAEEDSHSVLISLAHSSLFNKQREQQANVLTNLLPSVDELC